MNGQYLKIAIRRIIRNYKSNLLIFIGLILGFTSCLIIYTKITYELSFDSSHTQSRNTYRIVRVTSGLEYTDGGLEYRTGVYFGLPGEVRKSVPEISNVVSVFYLYGQKIILPAKENEKEKAFDIDDGVVFTEPSFFEIFDFGDKGIKWISGSGKQVLNEPFTSIITEEIAHKLFADQDPLGQDFILFGSKFRIEGVIGDLPENSDFPFKVILSLPTFTEKMNPGAENDWGSLSDNYQCYIVLNNRSQVATVEKKFKEIYSPHADGDYAERRQFKLQQLSQVHKDGKFGNYNNRTVSNGLLYAITIVGIFIFLIACFNYSNFFLAESVRQKKQIALNLILGTKPINVFFQFFTESLLVNMFALLISLQLAYSFIRNFNAFIDIPGDYTPGTGITALFFILFLLIAGSAISVVFPVLNLKLKSLSSLLKGSDSGYSGGRNLFGKGSIILQFIVAQSVIIATFFIIKQIYFINHKELGYDTENVIFARLPGNSAVRLTALKSELLSLPSTAGVSFSSVLPAEAQSWTSFGVLAGDEVKPIDAEIKSVDTSYIDIYSFTLLAGNNFSSTDTANTILVNREFLRETGIKTAEEAVGLVIRGPAGNRMIIKGVVEDFHSGSLHDEIRPCVFTSSPVSFRTVNIRLSYPEDNGEKRGNIISGDISRINDIWEKIFPGEPFPYMFLNERIAGYYKSDQKALNLFLLFAAITIFLCILGILGLSLSMNERRTKEIGLRKVNGATVYEIIGLLNRDFIKWVIIAYLIALPVAWFAINKWLQNFAYRTELSWWVFLLSGLLALIIAAVTVSLQSWRAATRNPVEALRYE
ncbi:MAG TPA: ABC transporter permease [Bacteroidales bacterium]|nr:ABC transporter permease [Bacteroidales bacterium]